MLVSGIRLGGLLALLYTVTTVRTAGPPFEQWEHLLSSASTSRPLSSFASAATNPSHISSIAAPSVGTDESWVDLYMRHRSAGHVTNVVDPSTTEAYDDLEQNLSTLKHQLENSQIESSNHLRASSPEERLSDVRNQYRATTAARRKGGRPRIEPLLFLPFKQEVAQSELESYTDRLTRMPSQFGVWPYQVSGKQFLLHLFREKLRLHVNALHDHKLKDTNNLIFGVWEQMRDPSHDAGIYRYLGAFEAPINKVTAEHKETILAPTVLRIETANVLSPSTATFKLVKHTKDLFAPQTLVPSGMSSGSIGPSSHPITEPTTLNQLSGDTEALPSMVTHYSRPPVKDLPVALSLLRFGPAHDAVPAEPPRYYPLSSQPSRLTKEEKDAFFDMAEKRLNIAKSHRLVKTYPFDGPYLTPHLTFEAFAYPRGAFWALSDSLFLVRAREDSTTQYAASHGNMISKEKPSHQLFLWKRSPALGARGYIYQLVGMMDSAINSAQAVLGLRGYKRGTARLHYLAGPDSIYDEAEPEWLEKKPKRIKT
ncbi:uncharacterized protein UTRI_02781_B [Ustilago trichophora]|uniref:Effector family protein Eff1 n=1 Tax=Ustilago trichophora TaxID=86804 RepID=A0A5C3E6B3_9BASI|nr:uncharacterized protein UTRI_02781_B [Ustilago trichophora]